MPLRVLHLSTYTGGGAGRAAAALDRAMRDSGIDSSLWCASGPRFTVTRSLERRLPSLQHSPWLTWRSVGRFASLTAARINSSNADVVNLHWITDGFLSVEEIGRITKPTVWTMHDMWAFTGTEHYASENPQPTRWQEGYTHANRPPAESGIDLDRWTWDRKREHWQREISLVPVSRWLRDASEASALARTWPTRVIPNVMDVSMFSPGDRHEARAQLGLPDTPLIAFTSSAGISDERKGWALLSKAMPQVRAVYPDVKVLVIGQSHAQDQSRVTDDVIWIGEVSDNQRMAQLLRAADVIAVPSTADNLPMTACEAQSAGRPVVAFDIGGLADTVQHLSSGYLARPFDTGDFAQGLIAAIHDTRTDNRWGESARERALETWSADTVVRKYVELYGHVSS